MTAKTDLEWKFHASQTRGRLVDLSIKGLLIALDAPLPTAALIAVRITSRIRGGCVDCRGIVLRSVPDELDGWHIVCSLREKLNLEQVHLIGRHLFSSEIV